MPITQSRVLELLRSAEDYQQAYDNLRESIERVHYEVANHGRDARGALDMLYTQVEFSEVKYKDSTAIILLNRQHYRREERRNNRRRERRGTQPTLHAPASILDQGRVALSESPAILQAFAITEQIEARATRGVPRPTAEQLREREARATELLVMGPGPGEPKPQIRDHAPADAQRNDLLFAEREAEEAAGLSKQGLDFGGNEAEALPQVADLPTAKLTHPDAVQFSDEVLESIAARAEARIPSAPLHEPKAEKPVDAGEYTKGKAGGRTV